MGGNKILIIVLIFLGIVFLAGSLVGRHLFPIFKYLPETEASKQCRELGGTFRVSYHYTDTGEKKGWLNFSCFTPEKELFKY